MRADSANRPNGLLDLGLDDDLVCTDVYAGEEEQAQAEAEMSDQRPHAEPVTPENDGSKRKVHIHIHRS